MAFLLASETGSRELVQALPTDTKKVETCFLKDVLKALERVRAEALLLDCGTNPSKGLQLLREIKAVRPEVPVIFITDSSSEETIIEAFRLGAKDFYKKPLNLFQLKDALESLRGIRKKSSHEKRAHYAITAGDVPASLAGATTRAPAGLLRAFAHMEDNFPADLSLEKLSAEAGMSKHHFCRAFKRHMGLPPMHLLTWIRIEKAKELLKTSSLAVSTVAMEVGFNDLSSFIKHFKRLTGRTPTGFKKSLVKGLNEDHSPIFH